MYDDLDQPEAASDADTAERAAWKQQLRQQFERWLESVEQMPETQEPAQAPDLYSLYEELTALRNESRKGNRKSAEIFSRFGESLDHFQDDIRRIGEQMTRIEVARGDQEVLPRSYFLGLVELVDRMQRLGAAFERTPQPGRFAFLSTDAAWRKAWANSQQGFSILVSHLEKLLQQAGIQRLKTLGAIFDPVTMVAVATIAPSGQPPNVVVEEVAPGYRWRNEILRPAEVKITKSES
jgi:molecular chaperone GrpE